jgi:hypothetical protein
MVQLTPLVCVFSCMQVWDVHALHSGHICTGLLPPCVCAPPSMCCCAPSTSLCMARVWHCEDHSDPWYVPLCVLVHACGQVCVMNYFFFAFRLVLWMA